MTSDLQTSQRFETPEQRRDFLGLAAIWSAVGALGVALIGTLRLPMPSVFPESGSRVKLGPAGQYAVAPMTAVPEHRLFVFRDQGGLYAVSAVCTHLGCVVGLQEDGGFFCPCHGSKFSSDGLVTAGPAPRSLAFLALSISPAGQLVVDKQKTVSAQQRLTV